MEWHLAGENVFTFSAVGDCVSLRALTDGEGEIKWKKEVW